MMAKFIAVVLVICGIILFTQDNPILGFIIIALGGVIFSKSSNVRSSEDDEVWEHKEDAYGDDGNDADGAEVDSGDNGDGNGGDDD